MKIDLLVRLLDSPLSFVLALVKGLLLFRWSLSDPFKIGTTEFYLKRHRPYYDIILREEKAWAARHQTCTEPRSLALAATSETDSFTKTLP